MGGFYLEWNGGFMRFSMWYHLRGGEKNRGEITGTENSIVGQHLDTIKSNSWRLLPARFRYHAIGLQLFEDLME